MTNRHFIKSEPTKRPREQRFQSKTCFTEQTDSPNILKNICNQYKQEKWEIKAPNLQSNKSYLQCETSESWKVCNILPLEKWQPYKYKKLLLLVIRVTLFSYVDMQNEFHIQIL